MRKVSILLLLCALVLILSSCEQTQSDIHCYDSFDDMDLSNVIITENKLSLALPDEAEYIINEVIYLRVINNSYNYIWMPQDYLNKITRIMENDENDAELIKDDLNRDALQKIILSPRGSNDQIYWSSGVLLLYPYLQTPNESEIIQVEVFGFEYRDGKICNRMYPAKTVVTLSR